MNVDKGAGAVRRAMLLFVCFLPMACSASAARVYPVRGEVFFDGKPANGAAIHFHPLNKDQGQPAFANVQDNGSFQMTTHAANDGAAPGEYIVTLSWRTEKQVESETVFGPDRLGERYSKPATSKLRATVSAGENSVPRFDLKK